MNYVKLSEDGISIEGILTRENVGAVRGELLAALSPSEAPRMVCLSGIVAIDSAGVQLLSALKKAYPDVHLHQPAEVVQKVLARMGALRLVGSTA